jgi:hypothetical protein
VGNAEATYAVCDVLRPRGFRAHDPQGERPRPQSTLSAGSYGREQDGTLDPVYEATEGDGGTSPRRVTLAVI